ncbi:unnamed protein product, partial [Timema podura]|nr:unnamed protein product [Timema podura]
MSSPDGGSQKAPYSPKPDIVAANNIVNIREMLRPPKFSLTQVDSSRREDIDNFYKLCQMHRDQYKDYSGRLHPLDYFKTAEYKWQCPPELTRTYKRYPQYYVKYATPTVLDGNQARTVPIPYLPEREPYILCFYTGDLFLLSGASFYLDIPFITQFQTRFIKPVNRAGIPTICQCSQRSSVYGLLCLFGSPFRSQ